MRRVQLCLGYGSIALAALGVFLPLLPTTPFLLLAVWCFARSNPATADRLYAHPSFGPLLTTWRDQRAISRRSKGLALTMLASSFGATVWLSNGPVVPAIAGLSMGSVALYLVTRPIPRACECSNPTKVAKGS
ncbi:YbaN family protein [Microvirga subterranea]|uniref:Inner membrane protein n=1 Tax=Microvirga subterranea TaxID=186651 RepID=A0A370HHT5_9HYPH|nr:YbaN family protein [Microvirga subterranea]RDI57391.1 hypothetical protein DES45_107313 [Microvirga subterranea]